MGKLNHFKIKEAKPMFKDLRFRTRKEFGIWLFNHTAKTIHLKDLGQDMQRLHVHCSGEILHCDFHSEIYNGQFVLLHKLKVNEPLMIWDPEDKRLSVNRRLIVESIE